MAERGFGVKEINLIGSSGTPTIESPNNLNLNAVKVAISTNVSIGNSLIVTGISTFTGNIDANGDLDVDGHTNLDNVSVSGVTTFTGQANLNGHVNIGNVTNDTVSFVAAVDSDITPDATNNNRDLGNTVQKWQEVHAVTYYGSGANLTNLPASTPTTSDIQIVYEITNQTSFSYYRFAGNGVDSSANNPDIYLERGQKYRFINNSGGTNHPFQIQTTGGSPYNTGVTNNNASTGSASKNIDFAVRWNAPAQLKYQCTNHGSMQGNIYISDRGRFPQISKTSNYVIVSNDAGKHIKNTSGGWTINTSTGFQIGDVCRVVNASGSSQTVFQASGVTIYSKRDNGVSGDHSILARGMATVLCTGSNEYYVSGDI